MRKTSQPGAWSLELDAWSLLLVTCVILSCDNLSHAWSLLLDAWSLELDAWGLELVAHQKIFESSGHRTGEGSYDPEWTKVLNHCVLFFSLVFTVGYIFNWFVPACPAAATLVVLLRCWARCAFINHSRGPGPKSWRFSIYFGSWHPYDKIIRNPASRH